MRDLLVPTRIAPGAGAANRYGHEISGNCENLVTTLWSRIGYISQWVGKRNASVRRFDCGAIKTMKTISNSRG